MNPHLQVDAEHTVGDCTEWVDANVEDSAGRLPVSDAYDAASRAVLILQSSARLCFGTLSRPRRSARRRRVHAFDAA